MMVIVALLLFLFLEYWQLLITDQELLLQLICYDSYAVPLHAMGSFGKFVLCMYLTSNHMKMVRLG